MNINSKSIKISRGKAEIATELELGADVEILIKGSVVKTEDSDNQDGTVSRCYVIKPILAEGVQLR